MKKFNIFIAAFILGVTLFTAPVFAAWEINLAKPPVYTNDPTFNLSFTTLTTDKSTVQVDMYQNGSLRDSTTVGGTTYGDSGFFPVNLPSDGTYKFYLIGNDGSGDKTTATYQTVLDTVPPETPEYNGQTRSGSQFTVSFTAASDGDTDEVAIYTSTSSTFTANDASRVGRVDVNPGETETFTYNAGSSQERFFAIQAFDRADNFSGLEGDEEVEVTQGTVTQPGGTATGTTDGDITTATAPTGTTATTGTGEEGEVEGVTTGEEEQTTSGDEAAEEAEEAALPQDESEDVLGAETDEDQGINAWQWILYGVLAAAVVYLIANRDLVADYIRKVRS